MGKMLNINDKEIEPHASNFRKRIIIDVTEDMHYKIKCESLKRNITMRAMVIKSLIYFLKNYSK